MSDRRFGDTELAQYLGCATVLLALAAGVAVFGWVMNQRDAPRVHPAQEERK